MTPMTATAPTGTPANGKPDGMNSQGNLDACSDGVRCENCDLCRVQDGGVLENGKPRLLDLFCGSGGAAVGYARAGFEVVGVDIYPQKHYPFKFMQADALDYVAQYGWQFDAIHASPPCQRYSRMTPRKYRENHPDLIAPVRFLLETIGVPYVIENVELAPLRNPVMLCGAQFGLKVYRHRIFESNILLLNNCHIPHHDNTPRAGHGNASSKGFITLSGGKTKLETQLAMGIDWMTADEMRQAIPPAYTEYLGRQLMAVVMNTQEARAA